MRRTATLFFLLTFLAAAQPSQAAVLTQGAGPDIEFSVYPNPSNGVFSLEVKSSAQTSLDIRIVNLIGQTLYTQSVETNHPTRIDVSNLPKGVYFIKIGEGQDQSLRRIVIQ
ncbi:MAG: T9SS type A sorting domain-containing protein [Bacteroidia bacterium]|nr:T9SS type A sorting domain-containing protein [Bacteroidia bacterium]